MWFGDDTPCPNGKQPWSVDLIGFQMWTCRLG
jgi:hypothetical protein